MFPGPYSTLTRDERITDLITRAGGLTDEAYPEGLQLWRLRNELEERILTGAEIVGQAFGDTAAVEMQATDDSLMIRVRPATAADSGTSMARTRVGVDYVEALRNAESPHNILVESSDSIYVPRFIPTVDVQGAVQTPTKVLFNEGKSGDYYIERAGGYLETADKGRARVQLANGEVLVRGGRFLFFGGGLPEADPGSVITVPVKPQKPPGPGSFELITVLGGLIAATATVILAATR
jgi:protein involved in polysaccharide export with SLBB domain